MSEDYSAFLEDAAHYPGGHAAGVVFPRSTAEVADVLRSGGTILPIGAQSSLTGGATPMGEVILSTVKLAAIDIAPGRITVGAGVSVAAMQEALARTGAWFPPSPTFTGACAGGIVATNAAGAATFKYGSVRQWVEAITVVLVDGTVLELARGRHRAIDGAITLDTRSGRIAVPVPTYEMPRVAKRSAGYHAEAGMDLVDLFVGSEGTLGVITEVTFRTLQPAPNIVLAFVPCPDEGPAIALAGRIREASMRAWQTAASGGRHRGMDAAAIEHMDRRSLEIVGEDGADRRFGVAIPESAQMALLVQLEVGREVDAARAFEEIQGSLGGGDDGGLAEFCRELDRAGVLADTQIALPHDTRRAGELLAVREAVPAGVNRRIGTAKQTRDSRIEKTAADMVVPFERFEEMLAIYRAGFATRGLDYAIWGHISDGNVHPNVIARSYDDVAAGKAAILEFGRAAARLGGCPLAEHGVGRNPVKQQLLRQLHGDAGIDEMRAVKRVLDPRGTLAPGVIFDP